LSDQPVPDYLDFLGFNIAREQAVKDKIHIPCWSVTSPERRAEMRQKALDTLNGAACMAYTMKVANDLIAKTPGMAKVLEEFKQAEAEFAKMRAEGNPLAFFVTDVPRQPPG
jgi:hypothetical protein